MPLFFLLLCMLEIFDSFFKKNKNRKKNILLMKPGTTHAVYFRNRNVKRKRGSKNYQRPL